MLQAEFEPAIPGSERSQTQALNCMATGIGGDSLYLTKIYIRYFSRVNQLVL
jgi:hypothetical protein